MEQLDIAIVQFVNSFAGRSSWFDRTILEIFQLNSFKMMPLVALLVWLWFSDEQAQQRRKCVLNAITSGFISLVITRLVQNIGPHRPRPAMKASFHFLMPAGGYPNDWNSFPSDTAGLAFALALGIWFASRRLGSLAFLWATVVICFPRLYGGYHYLSDLLAGAAIGMGCTYAFTRLRRISDPWYDLVIRFSTNHKPLFFMLAFILAFQTSTYFADLRKTGERVLHVIGLK